MASGSNTRSETQVFAAPVTALLAAGADLAGLSEDERSRALSYRNAPDRDRSIAAHWLKRRVLAEAAGAPPQSLRFLRSAQGKPLLQGGAVQFNLSHSGDWVAMALHPRHAVGIDVERDRTDWSEILPLVRAPQDRVPSPLHLWTAKEAVLKALGQGFLADPREVTITADSHGFACCAEGLSLRGEWSWLDEGHLAAVVGPTPFRIGFWTTH